MDNIFQWLNSNQGIVAVVAIVISVLVAVWIYKKQSKQPNGDRINDNKSSPFIKAGGSISAGGNISVGNHQTVVHGAHQPIPEFHLQLYGNGTKLSFDGHVEKKTDITLVIEFIEINGIKTDINRPFTKLTHLNDLNHDPALFKLKAPSISIKARYRTLAGEKFDYIVDAEQEPRVAGGFNIKIINSPTIKLVTILAKEELELVEEARKNDGQIYHMSVAQIPGGWIRVGKIDFHFEDNFNRTQSYIKALQKLVKLGYVEHQSGILYILSANSVDLD